LAAGGTVGGICSGYQILGRIIRDPRRLESPHQEVHGLGMIPVETTFALPKIVEQASGRHAASGCAVTGYQVRMGRTLVPIEAQPFLVLIDGQTGESRPEGLCLYGGRLFGTSFHGLFDEAPFRRWWLNRLRASKGWTELPETQSFSLEAKLDGLADFAERHVDMRMIDRLVEEGV
jgi:adenosylcobyric acid synthase